MRADLNIIFNCNAVFGIDISKCADVCFISQFKIIFMLNNPVVFCRFSLFDFRINPILKSLILPYLFIRGFAGTPPRVSPGGTDFVTHAPAPITASSPIVRGFSSVPLIITAPVPT